MGYCISVLVHRVLPLPLFQEAVWGKKTTNKHTNMFVYHLQRQHNDIIYVCNEVLLLNHTSVIAGEDGENLICILNNLGVGSIIIIGLMLV